MNKVGRYNLNYKAIGVITLFGVLLLSPVISFAQGGLPCGDSDPGNSGTCPLDTWVVFLAAIAVSFAVLHLHRKQKSLVPKPIKIK